MKIFNLRLIFKTISRLLLIESIFLLLMIFVPLYYGENDARYFLFSALICALFGGAFLLLGRNATSAMGKREGAVIVTMVWIVFSLFGMLPYWLSGTITSFTDASNKGKWKCSERAFDDYRKYSPKCLERWSEMKNLINTKEQKGKDCNDSR